MLTLTDNAASAIRTLTTQPGLPEETGVRIASAADAEGMTALTLSLTPEPEPDDDVVEAQGARVFVEAAVSPVLDDKSLDADINDQGEVQFRIEEGPGMP